MASDKTFMEQTAAPGASAGFDYQYYYFLYRLLNLKKGQSIGLEIKDDVHTELDNDVQMLFQLKHTIQKQADGSPIALTELDGDLWKTLHNWAKVISDPNDKRSTEPEQINFIRKTEFHLVTNKSTSKTNTFTTLITSYIEDTTPENASKINSKLDALEKSTTDATIKGYINTVKALSDYAKREFFKKIIFNIGESDIIQKIKDTIECKFIEKSKIDEVYDRINSNVRDDSFISITAGSATTILFDDFNKKYQKIFKDARSKRLSTLHFEPALPSDLLAQRFVNQLIAVDDICEQDDEIITEYSTYKVRLARSLEQWLQAGEIVADEIDALHRDVHLRWRNSHRAAFRKCSEEQIKEKGLSIVDNMRMDKYLLGDDELNTEYSNGELYVLSDNNTIGWHRDWDKI
ncbi:hypothetical protein J2X66_003203 [Pseudomonas sp. 3296]|uniref:ABC-three component system protein n=1 Tax=Pseudomonas sp. 3296 TaxID=2817753 RepID=UPI002862C0E6|nr:ABC-three component system protein [Pseudomonas sp. 3296]MDR6916334.1 hypothetical protein [Pseudomonas sp. 3296]